jgi:hypothetical protein
MSLQLLLLAELLLLLLLAKLLLLGLHMQLNSCKALQLFSS